MVKETSPLERIMGDFDTIYQLEKSCYDRAQMAPGKDIVTRFEAAVDWCEVILKNHGIHLRSIDLAEGRISIPAVLFEALGERFTQERDYNKSQSAWLSKVLSEALSLARVPTVEGEAVKELLQRFEYEVREVPGFLLDAVRQDTNDLPTREAASVPNAHEDIMFAAELARVREFDLPQALQSYIDDIEAGRASAPSGKRGQRYSSAQKTLIRSCLRAALCCGLHPNQRPPKRDEPHRSAIYAVHEAATRCSQQTTFIRLIGWSPSTIRKEYDLNKDMIHDEIQKHGCEPRRAAYIASDVG